MLERPIRERLKWVAMSLAPTVCFPFVLFSGIAEGAPWAWFALGALYLLVLGELYYRDYEGRRHTLAMIFAVAGCLLNGFVLVVTAVTLIVSLDIGNMGSLK